MIFRYISQVRDMTLSFLKYDFFQPNSVNFNCLKEIQKKSGTTFGLHPPINSKRFSKE